MLSERGLRCPISHPGRSPLHGPGDTPSLPQPRLPGRQYGQCVCPQELPSPRLPAALQGRRGAHRAREMPRTSTTPPSFHSGTNGASGRLSGACPGPAQLSARRWDSAKFPHPGRVFLSPSPLSCQRGREGSAGCHRTGAAQGHRLWRRGQLPSPKSPSAFTWPLLDWPFLKL